MKEIDYVRFAKENGFNTILDGQGFISMITSKDFIEAIAKGLCKKPRNAQMRLHCQANDMEDTLTKRQAIAIRDNKLDEFINKIIN